MKLEFCLLFSFASALGNVFQLFDPSSNVTTISLMCKDSLLLKIAGMLNDLQIDRLFLNQSPHGEGGVFCVVAPILLPILQNPVPRRANVFF